MKKLLVGLILVLCVALLSPWLVGLLIASRAEAVVNATHSGDPIYKVELMEYESGWRSSRGRVQIDPVYAREVLAEIERELSSAGPDGEGASFEFPELGPIMADVFIEHGPLLGSSPRFGLAKVRLEFQQEALREFIDWEAGQPLVELSGTVDLAGVLHFQSSSKPFSIAWGEEGILARWEIPAFRSEGEINANWLVMQSESEPVVLDILGPTPVRVSMGPVRMEYAGEITNSPYALYNADYALELGAVSGSEAVPVVLDSLRLHGSSELDSGRTLANLKSTVQLDSLRAESASLRDLSIAIELRNYSTEFHRRIAQQTGGQIVDESNAAELLAELEENLTLLLSVRPVLEISEFRFSMPEGEVRGEARIAVTGDLTGGVSLDNAAPIVRAIEATSSVKLHRDVAMLLLRSQARDAILAFHSLQEVEPPEPDALDRMAVQQAEQQYLLLVSQRMLVEQGDSVVIDVDLADGALTVNGRPIPLPF